MAPKEYPCLGCGKPCNTQQFSVCCTLCSLWSHKDCAGISDPFFKNLELQIKEMGQSFWACRSCISFASSFATKINTQLKEVNSKLDQVQDKVKENSEEIKETQAKVGEVEKVVGKVEKSVESMEKKMEENILEEMRAREAIKRNLVLYGVQEPNSSIRDGKGRMEADKEEC